MEHLLTELQFQKWKVVSLQMVSSLSNKNIIKTSSFETPIQSLLSFTSQWSFTIISFSLLLFHDPGTIIQTFYQLRLTFYFLWHFYFSIYNLLSPLLKEVIFTSTFPRHFHFWMAPSLSDEIPSKTCCFETLNQSLKIQFNFSHPSDFCETLTWL